MGAVGRMRPDSGGGQWLYILSLRFCRGKVVLVVLVFWAA